MRAVDPVSGKRELSRRPPSAERLPAAASLSHDADDLSMNEIQPHACRTASLSESSSLLNALFDRGLRVVQNPVQTRVALDALQIQRAVTLEACRAGPSMSHELVAPDLSPP